MNDKVNANAKKLSASSFASQRLRVFALTIFAVVPASSFARLMSVVLCGFAALRDMVLVLPSFLPCAI
ncbi:hypothetical protein [Geomonas edaphica]|uniref:hypothetical protein n=1 Tax=Geomonas edaphica TaxID=2570226 RepID=UPI0010A77BFC|nr:hypothetical protein [Geomonas edaphica]